MPVLYDLPLTDLAKEMRRQQTCTERLFWNEVRNRKILGYKFYRQKPIASYIADFYCHELSLVIELDGEIHQSRKEYDMHRTKELDAMGLVVIRYSNDQVLYERERVLTHLNAVIHLLERQKDKNKERISE